MEAVEAGREGTGQEEGADGVEEGGEVAGGPVAQPHPAHATDILEEVVGAVAEGGEDGEEAE